MNVQTALSPDHKHCTIDSLLPFVANYQLVIPLPQVDSLNKCLQYSQEENIALKAKIAQVRIDTVLYEECYLKVLTIGSIGIIAKVVPPM